MHGSLAILPLALTMMLGPQIMSSVVFVTTPKPIGVSLAYIVGIGLTASVGVAVFMTVGNLVGAQVNLDRSKGPVGIAVEIGLVVLLMTLAIKTYLGRATAKPPKVLATLMEATPGRAFVTALIFIGLMPTDLLAMAAVGMHQARTHAPYTSAIPFILLTMLIAGLPLVAYLAMRTRATAAMPNVRTWIQEKSWVVSIGACCIFILLILK